MTKTTDKQEELPENKSDEVKRKVGRPTLCTPELVQMAKDYLDGGWKNEEDHNFPSVLGLAIYLQVSRAVLYKWAAEGNQEFIDILARANELGEFILVQKGVDGKFNSAITKLVLGKHGYSEKIENTNKNEIKDMPTEDLEARLREIRGQSPITKADVH
jgi:hypothetical protein